MKNHLKNAEPIKAGTVIHTEKPFVYILSSKERTFRCDHCLKKTKVLKCSGCHYIHYCGKICQTEAWGEHKAECAGFKKVLPRVPPDAARLLAKLVRRLAYGGAHQRGFYGEKSFRVWKDLMSHYQDIKVDHRRMEHFACLCAILFQMVTDITLPNSAELMGIYGRMCVNSFTILDPELLSIGTGLYLGASIVDHSCNPNAVATFDGTTISLRTTIDLVTLDWSKVFISYVDLLNTPFERQTELQTTYYFLCQCERCLDQDQISLMHAAQCPNSSCDYPLQLPWREDVELFIKQKESSESNGVNNHNGCNGHNVDHELSNGCKSLSLSDEKSLSQCPKCGHAVDRDFAERFKETMEYSYEQLHNMKNRSITYVDVCRSLLERQQGILHPMNILHVQTLDMAMDGCIQYEIWEQAIKYATLLIPGFRNYYGPFHPLYGLLFIKLGKLQLYMNMSDKAGASLKKAIEVIKITHGDHHTLYRDILLPMLRQAEASG